MNNVLNNVLYLLKTFYEPHQYFCCYEISIAMCNMFMFYACVLLLHGI